jgi:hypothetical protein
MDKILFTQENLSKIHINQFEQFLKNHEIEYKSENYHQGGGKKISLCNYYLSCNYALYCFKKSGYFWYKWNYSANMIHFFESLICESRYKKDWINGDLTQFHILFTQVYNEIMGYEIK